MNVSIAGLIGAFVGLYVGWLDWKILKGLLQALEMKSKETSEKKSLLVEYKTLFEVLVFLVPMVGCPIVGYWAASQLTG